MADGLKLTCGLDADDNLVELDRINPQTHNGKACGLVCPACRTPLIARLRGLKMKPHLAHAADANCNAMTILHALAERILQIPGITLQLNPVTHSQTAHGVRPEFDATVLSTGPQEFIPTSATRNIVLPTGQQPDVFLTNAEGTPLAVEVLVTHAKSREDIARYRENNVDMLEIDLSGARTDMPFRDLCDIVLSTAPRRMHIDTGLAQRRQVALQRAKVLSQEKQDRFINWMNGVATSICCGEVPVRWRKVFLDLYTKEKPERVALDRMPDIPWSTLQFAPNAQLTHWVATCEIEQYDRPLVIAIEPDPILDENDVPIDLAPDVTITLEEHLGQRLPEAHWNVIADGYISEFARRHGLYRTDQLIQDRRKRPGRLITLCRRAGVKRVPKELGIETPHWGYPPALWQAALLAHIKEKIQPGGEVNPGRLATQGVFNPLLLEPIPDTPEARLERMADITAWLTELQKRSGLGARTDTDVAHNIFRAGKYPIANPFLLEMPSTSPAGTPQQLPG